jgi:hypothetical protein
MIFSMACKGKARAEDGVHTINPLPTDSIFQLTPEGPTSADPKRVWLAIFMIHNNKYKIFISMTAMLTTELDQSTSILSCSTLF